MDKREAVLALAYYARAVVDPKYADDLARACGTSLNALLLVSPTLVRRAGFPGVRVQPRYVGQPMVLVAELGAAVARRFELYFDADHAMQSPHGTPGKVAQFVGHRAAVRLARHFFGDMGVDSLREDLARAGVKIAPVLLAERQPRHLD